MGFHVTLLPTSSNVKDPLKQTNKQTDELTDIWESISFTSELPGHIRRPGTCISFFTHSVI